jgi:hypothetical protein
MINITFKAQKAEYIFKILPAIHIECNPNKSYDWAIVLSIFNYMAGVRFTKLQSKHHE